MYLYTLFADFGSAYSFPQQWSSYTKAVRKALQTDLLLQLSMSSTGGGRNSGGLREGYSVRLDGGAQVGILSIRCFWLIV